MSLAEDKKPLPSEEETEKSTAFLMVPLSVMLRGYFANCKRKHTPANYAHLPCDTAAAAVVGWSQAQSLKGVKKSLALENNDNLLGENNTFPFLGASNCLQRKLKGTLLPFISPFDGFYNPVLVSGRKIG